MKADYVRYLEFMCGSLKEQLQHQQHAPSAPTTPGLLYSSASHTTPQHSVTKAKRPLHFTPLVRMSPDEQEALQEAEEEEDEAEKEGKRVRDDILDSSGERRQKAKDFPSSAAHLSDVRGLKASVSELREGVAQVLESMKQDMMDTQQALLRRVRAQSMCSSQSLVYRNDALDDSSHRIV